MNIKYRVKQSPKLKKLVFWSLMPTFQARPRFWVKVFLHPFIIKKGKGAVVRRNIRKDIFPFHQFVIGANSTIEDYSVINNAVGAISIGNKTRIGIGSTLIGPVTVGDNVRFAQHVVATALNHNYTDIEIPISEQGVETKEIFVGDNTWIGANAVVLPGVYIGKHCVIGAGSVVTKDIPSYSVVAGNPARLIKQYNKDTKQWEKVSN